VVSLIPSEASARAGATRPAVSWSRPTFDWGNPDCWRWARLGPRIYPIPPLGLPVGFRGVDFAGLMSAGGTLAAEQAVAAGLAVGPADVHAVPARQRPVRARWRASSRSRPRAPSTFPTQADAAGRPRWIHRPRFEAGFDPVITFDRRSSNASVRAAGVLSPAPIGPVGPVAIKLRPC
jgi:hypothetical protein